MLILPENKYAPTVGIVMIVDDTVIPEFNTFVQVRSVVDDAVILAEEF